MALESESCKVQAEPHDAEAEDVVWIGDLFPLDSPGFVQEARAVNLARQDFAGILGPASERASAIHARPIGIVACDEKKDARAAAKHLVEDVEVPAIVGFRDAETAFSIIVNELIPNRVMSVITISQSPMLTRIPEPPGSERLVWRTTLNRVDGAIPLARLVEDILEPRLRRDPRGIGNGSLKIASVWARVANHDLVEAFFSAARFNGKSALDNGSNFRQFVYDADADGGTDPVVDQLREFAPHVIFFGSRAFVDRVLPALESQWPARLRPIYLTAEGLPQGLADFAGTSASKRRRFFSATNMSTTMTNAQLVLRYNLAFPDDPVIRAGAPQPSYDAFYLLAYSTYSLGSGAITGPALSAAISRMLPPGPRIDVGPAQVLQAFGELQAGGRIDLNGALGALDLNVDTGEAPVDYSIVCLGIDDAGRAAPFVESGLIYRAQTKQLTGSLRCP